MSSNTPGKHLMPRKQAILSLHDVMPETLTEVEEVLAYARRRGLPPMTLLIVPGRAWSPWQLERLREWAGDGHELAAHGWLHEVALRKTLYHRLHGVLISRHVAEHLSLDSEGIAQLMHRSHAWFAENELPVPSLYVPPAWALGRLEHPHLRNLPFEKIEVLRGFVFPASGKLLRLPMVGFEADTRTRAMAVRAWNAVQGLQHRFSGRPLRIGLHPHDLKLECARDLSDLLACPLEFRSASDIPVDS